MEIGFLMNDLIKAMSVDMKIKPYSNETEESLVYRILFSALGQWCLRISAGLQDGTYGTTKHNQTNLLNDLIERYIELFPFVSDSLYSAENPLPILIRRVYEETGHLITDEYNRNHLCNWQKGINTGTTKLHFNYLSDCEINGLGSFKQTETQTISWREFLVRDELTPNQFIEEKYDVAFFDDRDIDLEKLQYFNPLFKGAPSQSWTNTVVTEYTVGRKSLTGPFYLIQKYDDKVLFSLECDKNESSDKITSFEYRRLYFALKNYYNNPIRMQIKQIDDIYSKIRFDGYLPNREYYLLLLLSWPYQHAWNKTEFIIKNMFLPLIIDVASNLGIKVIGG